MRNKKGAPDFMLVIIVTAVLVVLVLVIMAVAFGWTITDLFGKISGYSGGKVNVANIVHSCELACMSNSYYDYCEKKYNVVFDKVNGEDNPLNDVYGCWELIGVPGVGIGACHNLECRGGSCSSLKKFVCAGEDPDKCSVKWVGRPTFEYNEGHLKDKGLRQVEDLTNDPRISPEDRDKYPGYVCEKRVML